MLRTLVRRPVLTSLVSWPACRANTRASQRVGALRPVQAWASWRVVNEHTHLLASPRLGYPKKLWLFQPSSSQPATRLLVFTDAEIYLQRVGARDALRSLIAKDHSTCAIFVSHGTEAQRMTESLFNPAFSAFLCEELRAFALEQQLVTPDAPAALCGLSLTGLATLLAALHHPGVYQAVAAQSGAYWPENGRVLRELEAMAPGIQQAFYFDVGSEETDREGEVMSQQEGIKAVTRVLQEKGYNVTHVIFDGGHETSGWRAALPAYLRWAAAETTLKTVHRSPLQNKRAH